MWPFKAQTGYLHEITRRVQALEEDLLALKAAHERLRGRFYATRGTDSPPNQPAVGSPEQRATVLNDFLSGRIKHGP